LRSFGAIPILLVAAVARAEEPAPQPTRVDCRSLYRACLDARDPDRLPLGGDAYQRGRARTEQRAARERVLGALLEVEVGATSFSFTEYDFEGETLAVDTERNLRLWGGRMSFYPSGGDALAFPLAPDRAREIVERLRRREIRLRIGFLLGHDDPDADPCLLRPGVPPIVKADIAYVELVDAGGRVLAREDTPRLADSHSLASPPAGAAGVTVTIAPPTVTGDRALAAAVEAQLAGDGAARLVAAIQACVRAEGPVGTVVVDLTLDGAGHASDVSLSVDSLHEDAMSACVRDAVANWSFPTGSRHARAHVSVPVMITRE
jgi:hypothetical protein